MKPHQQRLHSFFADLFCETISINVIPPKAADGTDS